MRNSRDGEHGCRVEWAAGTATPHVGSLLTRVSVVACRDYGAGNRPATLATAATIALRWSGVMC